MVVRIEVVVYPLDEFAHYHVMVCHVFPPLGTPYYAEIVSRPKHVVKEKINLDIPHKMMYSCCQDRQEREADEILEGTHQGAGIDRNQAL
jgi:hypothetical protein